MKGKVAFIGLVLLAGLLTGCSGAFPNSEGGFLDYITGNTVTRDKEANRHEEAVQAERARKAEAEADKAHEDMLAAVAEAAAADARAEEAKAREREAYLQAQVLQAEGDKAIKISVARALTMQSRLTPLLIVAILAMCPVVGLGIAYVIECIQRRKRGY